MFPSLAHSVVDEHEEQMTGPVRDQDASTTAVWVRAMDGLLECGAFAFAAWTLFYELALVTQWSLWWPARVWIAGVVGFVAWRAFAALRRGPERRGAVSEEAPPDEEPNVRWSQVGLFLAAAAVLVVLSALDQALGVYPVVLAMLILLVAVCVQGRFGARRSQMAVPAPRRVPQSAHAVAALVCLGLALLASALRGSSGDDVYYLNRAAWVADRGTPTLHDTVFSSGHLPTTYGNALPLASIEAWQGAMAHVLHIAAPSFVFLVTVPVLAAASGWATWRLVRTWAPRRAALVFVVAILFTLFSAGSVVGRYYIGVIWEGKVPAVTVVIPLVWHYLTKLAVRPRRSDLLMLLALGTCFVGLTSGAALIAPVMAAGAALAAWLVRSRACAVGAGCFVLAPLAAGVASALGPGVGGVAPTALPPDGVFAHFFGAGPLMALSVVAVALAVRLLRGPARVVAACAGLSGMASLLPGVYDLVNSATGAGPVAWRMVFGVPIAVLVGMLVTVRLPSNRFSLAHPSLSGSGVALAGFAVVVALIAQGTPLWSSETGTTLAFGQWKVDQTALRDVRAVSHLKTPEGLWLLPPSQMGVLAMTTTRRTAVVARAFYMTNLKTTKAGLADRYVLLRLVSGNRVRPVRVRAALRRLHVSLACVPAAQPGPRWLLRRAVQAPLERYGAMLCHVGLVGGPPARWGASRQPAGSLPS